MEVCLLQSDAGRLQFCSQIQIYPDSSWIKHQPEKSGSVLSFHRRKSKSNSYAHLLMLVIQTDQLLNVSLDSLDMNGCI